ncbi:hypothetical protein CCB80_03095 [Armatimonadetes bacterium Uphvl-Ar1]|nr:hypothetical protein CCB80_03095 [Armatimonadetes bacterium Uphvl-Ar1]
MRRRRKGSGSIFENKARGVWIVRYYVTMVDGKVKRKQVTCYSNREAKRELAKRLEQTSDKKVHYDITLGEWLDSWLTTSAQGNDHTKSNYARAVREAKTLLGWHLLHDVTAPMIDAALAKASTKRNAQEILKVLRIAFKEAQRERRIPDNPASLARPIKLESNHKAQIFTAAKLQKVLAHTENPVYRAFFAFLWATGARPWSEAAPLRWDDLIRDEDGVYFHGAKTAKGREPRPIANWMLPHLMALGSEEFIFPGNMDQSKVAKAWKEALQKAEVPHAPLYDLRRSFATIRAERGDPVSVVASLMGQSDSKTTEAHYIRIRRQEMRKYVDT